MMSLFPMRENRDTVWDFLPEMNRPLLHFYYLLLCLSAAGLLAVFTVRIPVSIPVSGLIRPVAERTEIHSLIPGIIETIFKKEGDTVRKSDLLFVLQDVAAPFAGQANEAELIRQQALVHDLQLLTATDSLVPGMLQRLRTPLYQGQAAAYLSKEAGEKLNWSGARHETDLGRVLVKDKVISPKEFYDQQLKEDKMRVAVTALHRSQWADWQSELFSRQQTLTECLKQKTELLAAAGRREVRAPTDGIVAGLRSWYVGCAVQPEQVLCQVSPAGQIVGECYVSTRNAGLLHPGQPLRVRIDAFNTGRYGILPGKILSVSDDISILDNKPVFTVRCLFDPVSGHGRKGYRGQLKKGFSFQARCLIGERTLFELLYENIDDWLNPGSASYPS